MNGTTRTDSAPPPGRVRLGCGDGSSGQTDDAHRHAAQSGNGRESRAALDGGADVADLVESAVVDGFGEGHWCHSNLTKHFVQ